MSKVLSTTIVARTNGLSVIPIKADGTKMPPFEWNTYRKELASQARISEWFKGDKYTGFGIICGSLQRDPTLGLEVLDFDDRDTFEIFIDTAEAIGLGPLVDRIRSGYEERTPKAGAHLPYFCTEFAGNTKLARRPGPDPEHPYKQPVGLIETRGEGGYFIAAPSNGSVHPNGGAWRMVSGSIETIATITPDERKSLWNLARSFDQLPPREEETHHTASSADGDRPGDVFRREHGTLETFKPLVTKHGWVLVYSRNGVGYFRRPDKKDGISASFGHAGTDYFYVFTTSTEFDSERGYNPFSVYVLLEHDGNLEAAVASLTGGGQSRTDHRPPNAGSTKSEQAKQDDQPWGEITELDPVEDAPRMPLDLIPGPLTDWITDAAERTSILPEMIAAPAIVAASSLVGRNLGIRPWDSEFIAIPNLWGALIQPPGSMKSFAIDEGVRFVKRLAGEATKDYEQRKEQTALNLKMLQEQEKEVLRRIKVELKKDQSTDDLRDQLGELQRQIESARVKERRYLTHDATVEKLAELLKDNPRGMLMLRDELYGLLQSFDKKGREEDRTFYLEGWSGNGTITIDRISRGTIHVPSFAISLFGSIQPSRIQGLVQDSVENRAGNDGLLQRFQMTIWPGQLPAWTKPTGRENISARSAANNVFQFLDNIEPTGLGASRNDADIPYLTFTPSAQIIADLWIEDLENRLRGNHFDGMPAYASHMAKYRSLMPSLALLFHLMDVASGASDKTPVTEAPVELAVAWCTYLEAHVRKIYDVEVDQGKQAARLLLTKITEGAIVDGQSVREIYRHHWGGLTSDESVMRGIAVLTDHNIVRTQSGATGGRPTQVIRINPSIRNGGK